MAARRNTIVTISLLLAGTLASAGDPQATQKAPAYGNSLGMDAGQPVRPPMPAPPQLAIAGDPMLGSPDAPVTIVEFIDYECPYCQGYARETFPRLKANYIDTGKVRYVARDFPLPQHGRARSAAIAAACAGEQGHFWQMHDGLLTDGGQLTDDDFDRLATRFGLDMPKFDVCSADPHQGARLDEQFLSARALGVSGTPSFLVGASHGDVAQGRLLDGDEDYAAFEKVLAPYLGKKAQLPD